MPLDKETVAIPFSSGIVPSMRARLLPATQLLTAQNCAFVLDAGPQKRNGHTARAVRTGVDYPGLNGIVAPTQIQTRDSFDASNPNIAASWLYGFGIVSPTQLATTTDPFEVSPQPNVGVTVGQASRDNEILTWDGHRLFSYAPSQPSKFGETQTGSSATVSRGPSCMPVLRSETVAKISDSQLVPDCADNGVVRAACWLNSDGTSGSYSAYDSSNGACLVSSQRITYQTPKSIRCIAVGPWFHIIASDTAANSLEMRSFHQDTPNVLVTRSYGVVDNQFDVKKISEASFVIAKAKTGVATIFICNADGSALATFTPALGGSAATTNLALACGVDKDTNIGLAWTTTGAPNTISFATYNQMGAVLTARQTVTTTTTARRLTLSPRFLSISGVAPMWDVFVEDVVASLAQVRSYAVQAGVSATLIATRHRLVLASHAFRVGNRNFVWCGAWITGALGLQQTWFLCDTAFLPCGKLDYGQANVDLGATLSCLPSVNFRYSGQAFKDVLVYHGCLPYNLRVPNDKLTPGIPTGVFTEPSIRFYKLDFLPQLRAGQSGRSTYFAGAQLWSYDGAEVVESGFHMAPEGQTYTPVGSGGAMSAGVVSYRIDLCHKNAQGEEVRSWSIISSQITVVANDRVTVSLPVMPATRKEDSYFLIFRTKSNGTIFYLANSRDPTSANFIRNNQASATFTYVDSLSDANLAVREYHPSNSGGNYLEPLPAPACETVAAGRDRLWLAGGELAPGEVAPSRLFFVGQAPAFTPALNIQIDRNAEPITAIGFIGEIAAIFRRTAAYTIDSDGPDNSLNGFWPAPRLAIADTGAIGPEGLALTVAGLWFQSPAGLRLLTNTGVMSPQAGQEMDPITIGARYAAAVVVPQYTQIRWYSRDGQQPTVVLDYSSGSWSTWTGLTCVGASFWPSSDLAVLSKGDGFLWLEQAGLFTDAGAPYEMLVRTSWLHGTALGDFQRVRRFALFGNSAIPTTIRARVFYDERPFHEEELVRVFDNNNLSGSTFNQSTWGTSEPAGLGAFANVWGGYTAWGDNQNQENLVADALRFRDLVFRFRWRPHRQKCSVFSVEFSDLGAATGGFEPVVLALELARKQGLDRIPTA